MKEKRPGRPNLFSTKQERLLRDIGSVSTASQLAEMPEFAGFNRRQIYDKARAMGVTLGHAPRQYNPGRRYTQSEIDTMKAAAQEGKTINEVAKLLKRSYRSVCDKARSLGLVLARERGGGV
jgi:hypothetical protein